MSTWDKLSTKEKKKGEGKLYRSETQTTERKEDHRRRNKDKIKYLLFIYLINLKDNFKVIIVTIYWELVAHG